MRRFSSAVSFALLVVLVFAGVASAHHSVQSQFDIHKTVTVSGTVSKVEWINPHSYLTLNVKDASGNMQKWAFELGGAGDKPTARSAHDQRARLLRGGDGCGWRHALVGSTLW